MRITVIPISAGAPAEDPGLPAPPGAVGGPSLCFGAVGPGPLVVERRALSRCPVAARLPLGRTVARFVAPPDGAMREPGWDRSSDEAYGSYDTPPGAPQSGEACRRLDPNYAARPPPVAPPGRPPGYAPAPPPPPMPGAGLWPDMGLWGGALQPPPARPRDPQPAWAAYVTGVPVDMRGDRLRRAFEAYGPVVRVEPLPIRYPKRGARSAIVVFGDAQSLERAMRAAPLRVDGARLGVRKFGDPEPSQQAEGSANAVGRQERHALAAAGLVVFAGGVPAACGDAEIKAAFECYGQVSRAWSFPANGSGDGGRARCAFVVSRTRLPRRGPSLRRARAGGCGCAGGPSGRAARRRARGHRRAATRDVRRGARGVRAAPRDGPERAAAPRDGARPLGFAPRGAVARRRARRPAAARRLKTYPPPP